MAKKSKGFQIPSVDMAKLKAVLNKAVQYNTQPTEETFPELPDVLIWLRFMLAVVYGSFLGIRNVRSATMLLHNLNLLVMYCRLYLGVGNESFQMAMVFSGLVPALALSTLLWIYFFTAQNEGEELRVAKLLVTTVINATTDDASAAAETASTTEESEF